MNNSIPLLFKPTENKTIVWLAHKNEYVVLENQTASILKELETNKSIEAIAKEVAVELNISLEETLPFIENLKNDLLKNTVNKETEKEYITSEFPVNFNFIKYYKVNNLVFKVEFDNELELSYVHPKFAHLLIEKPKDIDHTFSVFTKDSHIFLYVNSQFIGSWNKQEIHFFQGKFSMELIQKIHNKNEDEWLGVFHASAVSNGEKAILFLGDSGNGKSTSLSLLQANGFTCLADDFVPVDANTQYVYSFPAAISIKKTSLPVLLPFYPELENSAEYHFTRLNKIVRYLKPNNNNFYSHLPCKELVFIKYEKDSDIVCKTISSLDAFAQLVPDSWLSPKEENASFFLDWFSSLKCYQIKYSNNDKMLATISKIFNNEL
jgi:hypothetical protein